MAKTKEQPIPDDLLAMTLEELSAEEKRDTSVEYGRLLDARDDAQNKLSNFLQRKRDVTRAIVAKLEKRKKQ